MDSLSLAIGFVVGAITGAAGQYLGDKYTDKRRIKEKLKNDEAEWSRLMKKYPVIMSEMKNDVSLTDFCHVREFFVVSSSAIMNLDRVMFRYDPEQIPELEAAIYEFLEKGYIEKMESQLTPKYRMRESFVELLRSA